MFIAKKQARNVHIGPTLRAQKHLMHTYMFATSFCFEMERNKYKLLSKNEPAK